MTKPILLVDNLDSFTFNLVDALERAGAAVQVVRNSASAADVIARAERGNAAIVISPGPGKPGDAGCTLG